MHRKDLVTLTIRKKIEEEDEWETVAVATGSFLEQIKYEDEEEPFWTINDDISRLRWVEVEPYLILASDSSVR